MKLKHYDHDGRARFITFCTHKKIPLLTNNVIRHIVIDSIAAQRIEYGFLLIGYVIMPDHVHLVFIPGIDTGIGSIVGKIKRISSKRILKILKTEKANSIIEKLTIFRDGKDRPVFWQRRCYDHNCRSEKSMWEKVNYCHNNPVKRGLVKNPGDWEWSSYRWYHGYPDALLEMDSAALMK